MKHVSEVLLKSGRNLGNKEKIVARQQKYGIDHQSRLFIRTINHFTGVKFFFGEPIPTIPNFRRLSFQFGSQPLGELSPGDGQSVRRHRSILLNTTNQNSHICSIFAGPRP
jgi:hypothetical protein